MKHIAYIIPMLALAAIVSLASLSFTASAEAGPIPHEVLNGNRRCAHCGVSYDIDSYTWYKCSKCGGIVGRTCKSNCPN